MRAPILLTAALAILLTGCEEEAPAVETIARELFIETWVELRAEAMNARRGAVDVAGREAVLERMEVTERELLTFAEVHGLDPEFMREIWNEITDRLEEVRFEPTLPPAPPTTVNATPAG